jgi:hypothetical protein
MGCDGRDGPCPVESLNSASSSAGPARAVGKSLSARDQTPRVDTGKKTLNSFEAPSWQHLIGLEALKSRARLARYLD